jgi:hypothetical protein
MKRVSATAGDDISGDHILTEDEINQREFGDLCGAYTICREAGELDWFRDYLRQIMVDSTDEQVDAFLDLMTKSYDDYHRSVTRH